MSADPAVRKWQIHLSRALADIGAAARLNRLNSDDIATARIYLSQIEAEILKCEVAKRLDDAERTE